MTGFCTYEEIKAYVLPKAQYVIKEEDKLDPTMVTPTAKLDSVKLELLSGRSNTSKRCTNSDSVNTHYQNYSNHGDETSATPQGSHSSTSSDDDSLYYRVLNEFTKMHSTLAVGFCNEDIAAFDHFEGASHIYSFDAAMEKALVNNIVRQFKNTKGAWLLASFVGNLIEDYDLTGCFLASRIPCQMYKSGERRCCYIYVKNNWEMIKQSHDWMIAEKFGLCQRPEATNVKTQDVVNRIPKNRCTCNGAKKVSIKNSGHIVPTGVDNSTCYAVLSQFYEPVSIMELIKLAKMPLEKQIGWYQAKRHRPDFVLTRSRTTNIIDQKRRALCQQRNKLVELIATATDIKSTSNYVKALQKHIQQNYEPAFTFPFTMNTTH
uniref:Uncharacterized protein n=1 Tax=Babesia bovis TaxID=5865 RepID=S6C8X8_BABBO|nr:conserved hypothetical protein [Babesia bovis]